MEQDSECESGVAQNGDSPFKRVVRALQEGTI